MISMVYIGRSTPYIKNGAIAKLDQFTGLMLTGVAGRRISVNKPMQMLQSGEWIFTGSSVKSMAEVEELLKARSPIAKSKSKQGQWRDGNKRAWVFGNFVRLYVSDQCWLYWCNMLVGKFRIWNHPWITYKQGYIKDGVARNSRPLDWFRRRRN